MYKKQLQELSQRSCFGPPVYSCVREGPDNAPRFKATVSLNGENFESPNFCSTSRQAEHSAAEVALNVLSRRGPSLLLAMKIIDETGVCKNLLQETAQRAGVSLPVYTTVRSGPGHLPIFKCTVQVSGMTFVGESAKTKKQAEKNAAMAAWSALKQLTAGSGSVLQLDERREHDIGSSVVNEKDERSASLPISRQLPCSEALATMTQPLTTMPGVRVLNNRDKYRQSDSTAGGHFYPGSSSCVPVERRSENPRVQAYAPGFTQQPIAGSCRSSSPLKSPRVLQHSASIHETSMNSRQAFAANRATGRVASIRSIPTSPHTQRNELKLSIEEHAANEDEWLSADTLRSNQQRDVHRLVERDKSSDDSPVWSRAGASASEWGSQLSSATSASIHINAFGLRPATSFAPPVRVRQVAAVCSAPPARRSNLPPVRVRQVAAVCSAPPPRQPDRASLAWDDDSSDREAGTQKMLSQLRL
eukprot:c25555_g1_i1 orf=625-2046(+)